MLRTQCAQCAAPLAHNAPRCGICKTRYCGRDCQKLHWKDGHKDACEAMRGMIDGLKALRHLAITGPDTPGGAALFREWQQSAGGARLESLALVGRGGSQMRSVTRAPSYRPPGRPPPLVDSCAHRR